MSLVMKEMTFFGGTGTSFYLVIRIWGRCINQLTTLNLITKTLGRQSNQLLLCTKSPSTKSQCHRTSKHLFSSHVLEVSSGLANGCWAQLRWFCCAPGVSQSLVGTSRLVQAHSPQSHARITNCKQKLLRPELGTGMLFLPHFIDQNKSHGELNVKEWGNKELILIIKLTMNTELVNTEPLLLGETGQLPVSLQSHFHQQINTFLCVFLFKDSTCNIYC